MLTDRQRQAAERELQQVFSQVMGAKRDELLRLLGNPPKLENVPDSFWLELDQSLLATLEPFIVATAVRSAVALGESAGIMGGIRWDIVNTRASSWAKNYSYSLVKGINSTTRDMLRREIAAFYRDGRASIKTLAGQLQPGIPELRTRLGQVLTSETRAEMIAVTEVTRAAAQGEEALTKEIRSLNPNVKVVQIWLTSSDEITCFLCAPLHGKRRGNEWTEPPPRHPRCRCGIATALDIPGE